MTEPRLLQVFLSRKMHGIYEVSVLLPAGDLSCTCPGFSNRRKCKHIDFVRDRMERDGSGYAVHVETAAVEACKAARGGSAEDWRRFVYRHCPAEVL